MIPVELKAGQ